MAMSNISQEALPTAVGVTYLTYMTALPPEIVLGSFAGSVIFLLGTNNKPKWQWLVYFLIAFLTGVLGGSTVTDIGEALLGLVGIRVQLSAGIGALFAAACTINFVSWFRDNPSVLILWKKGDKA